MSQTATTNLAPAEPRSPFMTKIAMEVDPQAIDNLMSDALDFCSYWCRRVAVSGALPDGAEYRSEVVSRGGRLKFHLRDQPATFTLDRVSLLTGVGRYAASHGKWVLSTEADYDATDADAVLQLALFGEIIYG
jgi:hypothetical protein